MAEVLKKIPTIEITPELSSELNIIREVCGFRIRQIIEITGLSHGTVGNVFYTREPRRMRGTTMIKVLSAIGFDDQSLVNFFTRASLDTTPLQVLLPLLSDVRVQGRISASALGMRIEAIKATLNLDHSESGIFDEAVVSQTLVMAEAFRKLGTGFNNPNTL